MQHKGIDQLYRKPKRNQEFDWQKFLKMFVLFSVVLASMTIYGMLKLTQSLSSGIYMTIPFILASFCAHMIDGLYDMGLVWSNAIYITLIGVFCVLAIVIHPTFFSVPLFPGQGS